MLGRRATLAVVTVLACVATFVGVSWPRTLLPSGVSVDAGRASGFLSTVPTLPLPLPSAASPAPTIAEPPPTEPPVTAVVATGSGRHLSVGVAHQPSSPATIADAAVREVPLYSTPGEAEPDDVLDNPTWEGLPVVFLVMQRQGDWLQVQVSMRPNMATAWIHASDVTLRQTPYHVFVDTTARHLTLYDNQSVVFTASVAPGTDDTPTPSGDFFVDGIVKPPDPSGPYGAYQVSVAAFSNVLTSFGGGNGQIAIHGTNDPALIGTPASHGCVRMTNDDITNLVSMIPVGTPVRII